MTDLQKIITELDKYSPKILTKYSGISEDRIIEFEQKLKYRLPEDFKNFLKVCNGFEIVSDIVYGIHPDDNKLDLYSNYLWEKDESGNPIFEHLLPISPNGFGDYYCLDLKTLDENYQNCNIIFWQHDYEFSADDQPEVDCKSFFEFIWELLDDIKTRNHYDGRDK